MTRQGGEAVEVVDAELVVAHGMARTTWFVREGRGWVKAAEWPGATNERRDAGPGTVWERVVKVVLPAGTELMRVDVRPRPAKRRDPFAYLAGEVRRAARATERTYHRVERGGRLRPIEGRR